MNRSPFYIVAAVGLAWASAPVFADDPPSQSTPTQRQLMKECMAKQKASDGGMPKEQMKKNCKDVTKTESANAKAEKDSADHSADAPSQ
jgi:hypothetical protein